MIASQQNQLMIATLVFSFLAALLVFCAGRRDEARDPALTGFALLLLAIFPLVVPWLPKFGLAPSFELAGTEAGLPWAEWILRVWAAGVAVRWFRLAAAAFTLARWRKRSRGLAWHGKVGIRELEGLRGPVAAGVWNKVVFVPSGWSEWPSRQRELVLAHELAHHERHDPLWRWIAEIAGALNWHNPLVHWMIRRFTLQCEHACDARVLRHGNSTREYASLLCDLAEDDRVPAPALAMAQRSALESRIRRIMNDGGSRRAAPLVLLLLAMGVFAAACALIGSGKNDVSHEEAALRWSADPFPGEP